MSPGSNAPPVHPCCRCSTAAYYDGEIEGKAEGRRGNQLLPMNLQFFAMTQEHKNYLTERFLDRLFVGTIVSRIREEKQREHIAGTYENLRRKEIQADYIREHGPFSEFYEDTTIEEIQGVVNMYAGKGIIDFRGNEDFPIEYITVDKNIGVVYNFGEGRLVDTNRIAIVYSSKGVHVYPVKNW